ncbi:hypothetical protein HDV00_003909 [Rhizophlyctis rosea]|nr:hypothetical protein HDV00_003909 [Rhizophlyctis rosea]
MSTATHITKVAVIGASGHVGSYITAALLATGKHTVTAISRMDSSATFPKSVAVKRVDYEKPDTLVEALRGQEALVVTLGGMADHKLDYKIVDAAGEAGVKWIFPNEWSPDTDNAELVKDVFVFQGKGKLRQYIKDQGKSNFIGLSTGFWYEWSLAIDFCYGFDFKERRVTFFNEGENKITTSTWPQVGRAVASLLSLPTTGPNSLQTYANRLIYISSFHISQKDMFASVLRVTNTTESDWTVTKEPAPDRYLAGVEGMKTGDRPSFGKMLYSRHFWDDGFGDCSGKVVNEELGLPEEDLDEATKRGVERSKDPWGHYKWDPEALDLEKK